MAGKTSGLGYTITVDDAGSTGRDISTDVTNFNFSTPRGVQDITGVDKSAKETLLLLADFSVTFNGVADFDANKAHAVFKTVPSTSVARTCSLVVAGQTLAPEVLFSDYAVTRGADGSLTWSTTGQLADGTVPTWS